MNGKTKQRKRTLFTAIIMGFLVVLAGTFAWSAFSQDALNQQDVLLTGGGGRVHDDYNIKEGNKDIYAENYGAQPLLVRLKLSEYLEVNDASLVSGAIKDDRSTWTTYTLPEDSNNPIRDYVNWTLGGAKNYLPTFNTNPESLVSDAAGNAIDLITNGVTHPGNGLQDDFELGQSYSDLDGVNKHEAKATLTEARPPISMSDWKNLPNDQKTGNFWVIDTDGWAYWANPLVSGEATSLLLDGLNWQKEQTDAMNGKGYYAIHVTGEFTTFDDMDKFFNGQPGNGTEDGKNLLDRMINSFSLDFEGDVTNVVMTQGESRDFNAILTKTDYKGTTSTVSDAPIKWKIEPVNSTPLSSGTTIDSNGNVTLASNEPLRNLRVIAEDTDHQLVKSFELRVTDRTYRIVFDENVSSITMNAGEDRNNPARVEMKDASGTSILEGEPLTWTITSSGDLTKGTEIHNDGTLRVHWAEQSTSLKVTVKSTLYNVENSYNVHVIPRNFTSNNLASIGGRFTYHGVSLVYLENLGNNKHLAILNYRIPDVIPVDYPYDGGTLDIALMNYYNSLPQDAKDNIQPIQSTFNRALEMFNPNDIKYLDNNGWIPINAPKDYTVYTPTGTKRPFLLSLAEVERNSGTNRAFYDLAINVAGSDLPWGWPTRTFCDTSTVWHMGGDGGGRGYVLPNPIELGYSVRPAFIING